ncbi:MAG: DUF499 domain-containing protein [Rhodospirillales bacterium]|nr:DUF499 domain-containing protein [Acetobacter sp.]
MKSLEQLCTPRKSVFDLSRRDVVLDITDLAAGSIDADTFFEENYPTEGMKQLLREGFRRLSGISDQSLFVLSQAMGGGKTHSMIAFGLLAQHPELRAKVMGDLYEAGDKLGKARVIAFTGRESDTPLGIWGALAEQLGKKELFNSYYSPLQAPGQSAWINLLQGEPTVVLLDELPPYFENARSKPIGNSDLARVTATALSNLLVAVSKKELANVCVVISDLRATYQGGSAALNQAMKDFESETGRGGLELRPVALNTSEIYHILRTRIFEGEPAVADVKEVTQAYAQAVKDAKQMDITNASPEDFARQLGDSYPFHFSFRDLYARFRENPGFQQTRGLIRLMRVVVARMWESGQAKHQSLVHPYDIDLNHPATLQEIQSINPTLDNAIAHDIASQGQSVAEHLDKNLGDGKETDAQDASKLLLVSSLASVPGATLGLTLTEVVSLLCRPGRDVARLPKDVLGVLTTKAWYLHTDRDGRIFFKNVENLNAKLSSIAKTYTREISLKELGRFLGAIFAPKIGDLYQTVLSLPAVDEIDLAADKVTMVIPEPPMGGGLDPSLKKFWDDATYQNRVLFLAGERETMERLLEAAAELKAISFIIEELKAQRVPDTDPQKQGAEASKEKINLRLLSAARESFTKLHYPQNDVLLNADFMMNFEGNEYNGEKQIRETLKAKQKFTDDTNSDTFRKKCEQRLFTQQVMPWSEIKRRAAINTKWQWHIPSALDSLKSRLILEDQWREEGGLIDKGPFPAPETEVRVSELKRNDETGEVTLRLTPVHADKVHYEIGSDATTASGLISDLQNFTTSELHLSFLAVDGTGTHATGPTRSWKNRLTLKHRLFQKGSDRMCELSAAPTAPIRYTTDGSEPRASGGTYTDAFVVPPGTVVILAVAEKDGVTSEVLRIDVPKEAAPFNVDLEKPAVWKRPFIHATTKETYEFIAQLKKHGAQASGGVRITVAGKRWLETSAAEAVRLSADQIESLIKPLRELLGEGQVEVSAASLIFGKGRDLQDWVADAKTQLKPAEVEQPATLDE